MNIEELISSIKEDVSSFDNWKLLGDALRDENTRNNKFLQNSIKVIMRLASDKFIEFNHKEDDVTLILEILRAFVNLSADNDINRKIITDDTIESKEFWKSILYIFEFQNDNINTRIVIFFNQFIKNTELKEKFLSFFYNIEIDRYFMNYVEKVTDDINVSEYDMFFEFLSEYFNENLKLILTNDRYISVSIKYIDLLLTVLVQAVKEVDNEDFDSSDELILNLSNILLSLTSFEDIPGISTINPNLRCLSILNSINMNFENKVAIKRKLLSASGNITSMKTYNSRNDLHTLINYLKDIDNDPYLLSASAISIGNFVTSRDTSEELKVIINKNISFKILITNFFTIKFNDIIQYQAIHMLNNLLDSNNSIYVSQQNGLYKMSKSIIDNTNYYKEVFSIYQKFIKKVIRFEFIQNRANIMPLIDLWNYFENIDSPLDKEEIFLLLLQASIGNLDAIPTSFLRTLIKNMVSVKALSSEIPFTFLAEKLKTMGMFNQKIITLDEDLDSLGKRIFDNEYENVYISPMLEFFKIIYKTLTNNGTHSPEIIWNNSRFVSATAVSLMERSNAALAQEIIGIARKIVALKND